MRGDMNRLIVDCGRGGGSERGALLPRRPGDDFENYPNRESMSRHRKKDYKSQCDRLSPLRKYLASQVGRKWDKVFSEICAVNDKRSLRAYHLMTHLFQDVLVAGNPRGSYDYHDFIVDRNGILQRHDWRKRQNARLAASRKPKEVTEIVLGDGWFYRKIKGLWFKIKEETKTITIPGHFATSTSRYASGVTYWVNTQEEKNTAIVQKTSCGQKDLKAIRMRLAA